MGSRHFAFLGLLAAFGFTIAPSGCGNRGAVESSFGSCSPGKATCLSTEVGQICNAQGQWATFQCGVSRRCEGGACVHGESLCSASERECLSESVGQLCSKEQTLIAFACAPGQICREGDCLDTCVAGTHECGSEVLQRICRSDGTGWDAVECPPGSNCSNGTCEGSCEPGIASCITNRALRICRDDATGYAEQECPASMSCSDGKCAPNASATCSFGQDVCLNEATSLECLRDGSGYRVKDCPTDTRCRNGKCFGTVCAAGTTTCASTTTADFVGVQTCNEDGSGYDVVICNSAGKCAQNQDTGKYECYVPPCTSGDEACGEPAPGTNSTDSLSRCETLSNGKLGWVSYRCDSPAICKSTGATAAACHAECSPGDQRCSTDGLAVETCSEDSTWKATSCSQGGGTQDTCVLVPTTKKAVCGDKDCRVLQSSVTNYETRGRCSSNLIRYCNDDGRLAFATECEEGQCIPESDGLGSCKDPTRCQRADGWRECIASNDAYRTCKSGHWEFTLCAEDALCSNVGEGLATCGDDCIAGKTRCADAAYQICAANGAWGPALPCSVGECNPLTNRCETACVPGQLRCAGDVFVAADGSSLGSAAVQRCSSSGAWGAAEPCKTSGAESTLCRRSGVGEHLGCIQCVGPAVKGGNEEGAVDSRCSPEATGYQICQADNRWPNAVSNCTGTERCKKQRDGAISGTCSNYGCTTGKPKRCVGYETLATAVSIEDCCAGECDSSTGQCLHRRSHYDPTCLETTSCFTGRYDSSGIAINETCCTGFCRSGQGCLKIQAKPCDAVTSCTISKLDHNNVCCGTCLSSGLCAEGSEAPHPFGEYFSCGIASNICWAVGSCAWQSVGSTSGAMFANCIE